MSTVMMYHIGFRTYLWENNQTLWRNYDPHIIKRTCLSTHQYDKFGRHVQDSNGRAIIHLNRKVFHHFGASIFMNRFLSYDFESLCDSSSMDFQEMDINALELIINTQISNSTEDRDVLSYPDSVTADLGQYEDECEAFISLSPVWPPLPLPSCSKGKDFDLPEAASVGVASSTEDSLSHSKSLKNPRSCLKTSTSTALGRSRKALKVQFDVSVDAAEKSSSLTNIRSKKNNPWSFVDYFNEPENDPIAESFEVYETSVLLVEKLKEIPLPRELPNPKQYREKRRNKVQVTLGGDRDFTELFGSSVVRVV